MKDFQDGPRSPLFTPLRLHGQTTLSSLDTRLLSNRMALALKEAPNGSCTCWGIPFEIDRIVVLAGDPFKVTLEHVAAKWLVFMHTSDFVPTQIGSSSLVGAVEGPGRDGEIAAHYTVRYEDGSAETVPVCRHYQIGPFKPYQVGGGGGGQPCYEAVPFRKPYPVRAHHEQMAVRWGPSQMRVGFYDVGPFVNWLWAWENPHPDKRITGLEFRPAKGVIVVSAVSYGSTATTPLRWRTRRKAMLRLPPGEEFRPQLDSLGVLPQIQLDLGQVISVQARPVYPDSDWVSSYVDQLPAMSGDQLLVEYTAHAEACFHLRGDTTLPVGAVEANQAQSLRPIEPAFQRVALSVTERGRGKRVAAKLHIHGEAGEYLAPIDRHRILNTEWFEDFSTDIAHQHRHWCTYIPGETRIDLPIGKVFVEVSKGFEIRPVRRVYEITPETAQLDIEVERVLPWRERGWVTADTHVHFLCPTTALLEGAGEGVNIVNVLATQLGELMSNVGDFDGKNTWGSRETGGDGEYLVRVGTENRQHAMGHISLLGYRGPIIAPMTTGGPDESALGDPVEILMTEWARQCRRQEGLVVLPHFPHPHLEGAVCLVEGVVDAVEMTSWQQHYLGIDPYSLVDWYRYLNCGYLVAAVGGTDKMDAATAVGTVRTYAHINRDEVFTYEAWKDAVRRAETFVTYGPLLDFRVEGKPMGSKLTLPARGATLAVNWEVASVTVPASRVELVVNGEVRESVSVPAEGGTGSWNVHVEKTSWLALLVRGHYADQPEMIAAHSSPLMVAVQGTPVLLSALDAVTILEQIEGTLAYLDTAGTRADDRAYKRMRLVITGAHRRLHLQMHEQGFLHKHSLALGHDGHS